jgi:hypothetical protein
VGGHIEFCSLWNVTLTLGIAGPSIAQLPSCLPKAPAAQSMLIQRVAAREGERGGDQR